MDEPRSKQLPHASPDRFTPRRLAPLLVLTLAGCLSSEPRTTPSATPTGFAALAQEIAKFRELPLKRAVALTTFSADAAADDYAPFQTQHIERAYKAIGLLPSNVDLGKALIDYRRLERLVVYNEANAAAALAPNAAMLGAPFEKTDPALAREAPLGFAIVAALQEQNFQWQGKITALNLEDRRLAFRALATGDAALTIVARARGDSRGNLSAADLISVARLAAALEKPAARLPNFLRHRLLFPYREGSQFALWALKAKGWHGVNAIYANPPLSTAQILHPEKYFSRLESPLRFFPAGLIRRMKEGPLVEQTIGEYLLRGLLATEFPAKLASEIASPWRGDQLFAFQDGADFVTAWFSSWQSENDAIAFQRSYRTVLEKRLRIRFDASAGQTVPSFSGISRDGRGVVLQVNGPVVMFLSGVAANRLSAVTEAAWKDLEIEADSTVFRFDSARNRKHRDQLSLSNR